MAFATPDFFLSIFSFQHSFFFKTQSRFNLVSRYMMLIQTEVREFDFTITVACTRSLCVLLQYLSLHCIRLVLLILVNLKSKWLHLRATIWCLKYVSI